MSAPFSRFDRFLEELAAARSLSGKVRLLARHWRQIDRLPAAEKQRVALALGSRLAWNRLERLFARDGSLSDGELLVKRVLGRIGSADPAELRELAAEVRRGERAALEDRLLEEVERALLEEAAEREEPPPPREEEPAVGEDHPREDRAVEPPKPVGEEFSEVGEEARPVVATEPRREPAVPPEVEPVASSAPEPVSESGVAAAEPRPEAASPGVEREARRRLPPLPPARRLRVLRALHRGEWRPEWRRPEGRARLLARLGPGWAARRAVSELIRHRAPDDLAEALELVARLATPMQQAWCLGDLLAHWELDDDGRRRVVAAAPSPATRRRLERRAGWQRR